MYGVKSKKNKQNFVVEISSISTLDQFFEQLLEPKVMGKVFCFSPWDTLFFWQNSFFKISEKISKFFPKKNGDTFWTFLGKKSPPKLPKMFQNVKNLKIEGFVIPVLKIATMPENNNNRQTCYLLSFLP